MYTYHNNHKSFCASRIDQTLVLRQDIRQNVYSEIIIKESSLDNLILHRPGTSLSS